MISPKYNGYDCTINAKERLKHMDQSSRVAQLELLGLSKDTIKAILTK